MLIYHPMNPKALLEWYVEAGVDEAVAATPQNRFASPTLHEEPMAKSAAKPALAPALTPPPSKALAQARALADAAKTLDELRDAVKNFDGCALKKTATNTVFADGNPNAKVMVIGEAPGEKEDQQGIPFCGLSGQLLDKMFATIGLSRAENLYITNTIFWRPPGNRNPSPEELAVCEPFVEKHIALMNPTMLICAGSVSATNMLKSKQGISKLRGSLHTYHNRYMEKPVDVAIVFHPSYLLRSPSQKKLAWQDLLQIKGWLEARI